MSFFVILSTVGRPISWLSTNYPDSVGLHLSVAQMKADQSWVL